MGKIAELGPIMKYLSCDRCRLSESRRTVVLGDGHTPADILFIGEAPGKTEDLMGLPFVGASGRVLRKALEAAESSAGCKPTIFITNLLGCRPTDGILGQGQTREPEQREISACWQRLQRTEQLVNPKKIIILGKIATGALRHKFKAAVNLLHPDYILRQGGLQSTEYRMFVRHITDIFREVKGVPKITKRNFSRSLKRTFTKRRK